MMNATQSINDIHPLVTLTPLPLSNNNTKVGDKKSTIKIITLNCCFEEISELLLHTFLQEELEIHIVKRWHEAQCTRFVFDELNYIFEKHNREILAIRNYFEKIVITKFDISDMADFFSVNFSIKNNYDISPITIIRCLKNYTFRGKDFCALIYNSAVNFLINLPKLTQEQLIAISYQWNIFERLKYMTNLMEMEQKLQRDCQLVRQNCDKNAINNNHLVKSDEQSVNDTILSCNIKVEIPDNDIYPENVTAPEEITENIYLQNVTAPEEITENIYPENVTATEEIIQKKKTRVINENLETIETPPKKKRKPYKKRQTCEKGKPYKERKSKKQVTTEEFHLLDDILVQKLLKNDNQDLNKVDDLPLLIIENTDAINNNHKLPNDSVNENNDFKRIINYECDLHIYNKSNNVLLNDITSSKLICICGNKVTAVCACEKMYYCSDSCQKNDWENHRNNCVGI